ncbi:hypothetical protein F5B20DRAFT_532646 [Whalleya microplaca]|nr:hypothetical protein F5B20DRAFT_532646 [Whalleya microplaca]
MAPKYKTGQTVNYMPVGGPDSNTPESTGKVTGVLTEPGKQASRNVQASQDSPRYEAGFPHPLPSFHYVRLDESVANEIVVCIDQEQ